MTTTMEPMTKAEKREATCHCGQRYEQEKVPVLGMWMPPCCDDCFEETSRRMEQMAEGDLRRSRWATATAELPELYVALARQLLDGRTAILDHPRFPRAEWERRLAEWRPTTPPIGPDDLHIDRGRGLLLAGGSGTFKTTVGAALLLRHHVETGETVRYLSAQRFGEAAQERKAPAKTDEERTERYEATRAYERAKKAKLLLLDDLGKQSHTAHVDKAIKALLEERTSRLLPTIITTQHSKIELRTMFRSDSEETAAAIVRRLEDYFDVVITGA